MIVYKISNIFNEKVYIGQTIKSLSHRKSGHKKMSYSKNLNPNSIHYFMNDVGFENFIFETLKVCDTKNELDHFEKYYIDFYRSDNSQFGYNFTSGGTGNYGYNDVYRYHRFKNSNFSKKVDVYTMDGIFYLTFESINEAGRRLEIDPKKINRVLKGKRRSTDGFIFKYNDGLCKLKIELDEPYNNNRKIAQLDRFGNKIAEFPSIKEASRLLSIDRNQIQRVLCGRRQTTHNFKFCYL
jgi:plasmid maintenance system antidote protein VapI